jgi:hypothetical protein
MTHRADRYHNRNRDRAPREVTQEIRDRCLLAAFRHRGALSEAELAALRIISDAYASMAFVTKADIDRAAGILGRLNGNG